jgi:hypothetical protein
VPGTGCYVAVKKRMKVAGSGGIKLVTRYHNICRK